VPCRKDSKGIEGGSGGSEKLGGAEVAREKVAMTAYTEKKSRKRRKETHRGRSARGLSL